MKARLGDPALRRDVEAAVRRRIRGDEAEDVVQATLADVLSAQQLPEDPEEFRRFVFGVARNKVFDHYRRQKRHTDDYDAEQAEAPEAPLSARDILRWAEGELPDSESKSTLEWMLREGDGEKLEHIARDASVPAPRVRKRVSRLRKFLRERWQAELLLAGLLVLLGVCSALYWYAKRVDPNQIVVPEPRGVPSAPHNLPPSRPAGDSAPVPSAAPEPAPSLSPAPRLSSSAPPSPSALLMNRAPIPRATFDSVKTTPAPTPTFDSKTKPAPRFRQQSKANDSDLFDVKDAKPEPPAK
jgi:RNA polymerase sigma factor (sigma-70 family)